MGSRSVSILCAAALLFCATAVRAKNEISGSILVDVELVIAADASISMDPEEKRLQHKGFTEAFRHPDVIRAIAAGALGRIAVTYIEWGGEGRQRIVVPWALIDGPASAARFADDLEAGRPARLRRGTSLSSVLLRSQELLMQSGFSGTRRIVNVSSDGVNNKGPDLALVHAKLMADGITINGLPIVYKGMLDGVIDGPARIPDPQSLIDYFQNHVIGGPHAFVEPVFSLHNYADAIRRKLVREIGQPLMADLGGTELAGVGPD